MFHACVQRFNGIDEIFLGGKLNRVKVLSKSKLTLRKGITIYMYMDKSRLRLSFICIKLSFYTCKVSFHKYCCKRPLFLHMIVLLKNGGLNTILSVVEPLFPQHNGSQPFISKITLTLMFSLIPTHLVVETKP